MFSPQNANKTLFDKYDDNGLGYFRVRLEDDNDPNVSINHKDVTCGEGLFYATWQFLSVSVKMAYDARNSDVRIVQGVEAHDHVYTTNSERTFTFHSVATTWQNAKEQCLALGGDLVSIHNSKENKAVLDLTGGVDAWIGLNNSEWSDGSCLDYANWDQTLNQVGDCVVGQNDYTWNDMDCND